MLLDNLRSVVSKSLRKTLLVGCENGNETVECGMTRKSKSTSAVAVDCRRGDEGLDPISFGGGTAAAMASKKSTELQLLEVSRGARELTQMIDSWSKVPDLDRRSKEIAEDIVRGALDLQESLIMLERVEEAAKTKSQIKDRGRSGFMEERGAVEEEEFRTQLMGSRRSEIGGYSNRLQEQRLCYDQSSRSLGNKLKNASRDSIYGQNLRPISSDDETACSSRSLGYSASSGLDDACYDGRGKAKSSQPAKVKAPNLIAKLMGLDQVPSAAVLPIKREDKSDESSLLNPPRLSFDIKVPKAGRVPMMDQNPNPERETLQNIIETAKSKELMKSDHDKDCRFQSSSSSASQSELYGGTPCTHEQVPTVMIMKPVHLPCPKRGQVQKDPLSAPISVKKVAQSVKLEQQEIVADNGPLLSRKSEGSKARRLERTKVGASQKRNTPASLCHKQQRREPVKTLKKAYEGQKPWLNGMHGGEKKDVKAMAIPLSQAKATTKAPIKTDKRLAAPKNASRPVNIPRKPTMASPQKPKSQNSTALATDGKTTRTKPVTNGIKAITPKSKAHDKEINPSYRSDDASTRSNLPADDPPKQEEETKSCSKDHIRKDCKVICEVMPKASKGGRSSGTTEAAAIPVSDNKTATQKAAGIGDELKKFLLSSRSFLVHAEELFGFDAYRPLYEPRNGLEDFGARNEKLYFGCAEELMARKSNQIELSNHPMSKTCLCSPSAYASLDHLVGDISSGIGKLSKYGEVGDDVTSKDVLYIRLERDLRCKELLLDAMWDIGWGNKICLEEADQVVVQVEELLLDRLVEEVSVDLAY
ncbi:uncharacterized protein LOC103706863 [Phoenix dactylifera]|uniref:Uncharacterized protein LOC103706863 n=1 Tax=Phoenix dactylifera TaxID=42345 RepID=A0A8B9ABX0_PHODC|nr:uncharacterized protein LOC103706863 [Phoenix dactylifera]XP_038981428.1 uncharacterized protein LOC103706863 [Phoenix dactylifera]XP_038981429.1 uncharacterized protein LOC103706863 [Phoenix dactylifera]XP_038981430.1 uncharacterized protein LOC103706863 [Phoenix dactylifera]XP_038981431.1 uncharacterized protein LOC103706863 [Phoenix dactylifera]